MSSCRPTWNEMIPCILARTWTLTAGFLDQSAILGVPLAHQDVRTGLRKETMALVSVEVQVIPSWSRCLRCAVQPKVRRKALCRKHQPSRWIWRNRWREMFLITRSWHLDSKPVWVVQLSWTRKLMKALEWRWAEMVWRWFFTSTLLLYISLTFTIVRNHSYLHDCLDGPFFQLTSSCARTSCLLVCWCELLASKTWPRCRSVALENITCVFWV